MKTFSTINYTINWNGDSAITLYFERDAGEELTLFLLTLKNAFKSYFSSKVQDIIPAYQSLTLYFDITSIDIKKINESVHQIINDVSNQELKTIHSRLVEIPVCYNEAYAPDIASLAMQCQLSVKEVIDLHTQKDYLVNMLGFLPGFLYLSGLNEQLFCPRKHSPALNVPAGAIGIGGNQTGIYPVESPGGWQLIGRTPVSIFNPLENDPFIAQPLDRIRFIAIDKNEFEQLIALNS